MDRSEAIKRIKAGLESRSKKKWSVKGGRGTGWGWLRIDAPPSRRTFSFDGKEDGRPPGEGYMSLEDRRELAALLGMQGEIHAQGESVPSGGDYYEEFVDRAEGRTPTKYGKPYWD